MEPSAKSPLTASRTRIARLVSVLLAMATGHALADQYQDAIEKAFPGFRILGPSDIALDRSNTRADILAQVKDRPGLVVGKFNADDFSDFAALIRGAARKTLPADALSKRPARDYFDGYLVVCYGAASRRYDCHKLNASPMPILSPHRDYLVKVSAGRELCTIIRKFKAPKPKPDPNVLEREEGPEEIKFATDAIGLFGTDAIVYVSQPQGSYLECHIGG
jgi:hypothetical protein